MNNLSIDIGGTKIRIVKYSPELEIVDEILLKTKEIFSTNTPEDLNTLFSTIKDKFPESYDIIGISMNCAMNAGVVIFSSLLGGGKDTKILDYADKYFKYNKFVADNDVVCMAKAESVHGYGKKYSDFLFVNLGTGIRLSYIQGNRIVTGHNNTAGEISISKIWVDEFNEYVLADDLLAGKGISNIYRKLYDREKTSEEIFDEFDQKTLDIYVKYLSEFLINSSLYYNPEAVVFGGSLTKSSKKWLQELEESYRSFKYKFILAEKLLISQVQNPASLGALIY